jgi:hypothetical protein
MAKKHEVLPQLGASIEYLVGASPEMLAAFELARLNCSANLRKSLVSTIEELVAASAEAALARALIEYRKQIRTSVHRSTSTTSADLLAELLVPTKRLGDGRK